MSKIWDHSYLRQSPCDKHAVLWKIAMEEECITCYWYNIVVCIMQKTTLGTSFSLNVQVQCWKTLSLCINCVNGIQPAYVEDLLCFIHGHQWHSMIVILIFFSTWAVSTCSTYALQCTRCTFSLSHEPNILNRDAFANKVISHSLFCIHYNFHWCS